MPITASALAHRTEVRRLWGATLSHVGTCNVRPIDNDPSKGWSQHAYCNANDFHGNPITLQMIATWSVAGARRWGVATVIWNRRIWSYHWGEWRVYTGDNPHTDHVHVDYLPRYTGNPPGFPVGQGPQVITDWPWPPVLSWVYPMPWRRSLAIALWGAGFRAGDPLDTDVLATRAAVVAFRRAQGWPTNTAVTEAVWSRLGGTTVRRGNRGQLVRAAQLFLKVNGIDPGPIDGIFGPRTEQAVLRMQQAAHRTLSGRVAPADWRALYWGAPAWRASERAEGALPTDWAPPPAGTPSGDIEHSWAQTLYALAPNAQRAAAAATGYATAVRRVTQ